MIYWNLSLGDEKSVLTSDGLDIVWSQPSPHNSSSSLTFRKWSLSHWTYSLMDLIKPLLNCYPFMFHCLCKLRKTRIEILAKIIWENIILFIALDWIQRISILTYITFDKLHLRLKIFSILYSLSSASLH